MTIRMKRRKMTINIYLLAKKIHRLLVLIITTLGLLMTISGIILKYGITTLNLDLGLIRYLHSQLSVLFTIVLILMTISGIILYLFPILKKRK